MRIRFLNNEGAGFAGDMEVASGVSLGALFETQIGGDPERYVIRVNGRLASQSQTLQSGDDVRIVPMDGLLQEGDDVSVTPKNVVGGVEGLKHTGA